MNNILLFIDFDDFLNQATNTITPSPAITSTSTTSTTRTTLSSATYNTNDELDDLLK